MRLLLLLVLLLPSCAVFKSRDTRTALKIKREVSHSTVFTKAFTGFTLLDPATGKTLTDFNGDHYFTPASNTKILTLATCLEVLGDSIPGLKTTSYKDGEETINYLKPTGDPTFLHPFFKAWQPIFYFLVNCNGPTTLDLDNFQDTRLGPGWAWDDYNEDYSAERSAMPIFGNVMTVQKKDSNWLLYPFNDFDKWGWNLYQPGTSKDIPGYNGPLRSAESNAIYIPVNDTFPDGFSKDIPFRTAAFVLHDMLRDTTQKSNISTSSTFTQEEESEAKELIPGNLNWQTLYSSPIDTVLRRMMHQSDNFIAEQMLLVCAGMKFDLLKQDTMIKWMLDSTLTTLPQRPRWVDGSGLSRYNLMTPQSIAQVLLKLWEEQPHERVLSFFPAAGVSGTVSDYYVGKDKIPFVFAKTGGMGGVQCLSGYLLCKSGKVLIFSFMHNNFLGSSKPLKEEMQRLLEQMREEF
ncbi:MAG: D-alanyl-D-alanine carboxypeptidase [Phycisphaerae bacterium]|nr:D-alanyl-D-alanine carboxypeptidase [Saprospiraceae bacterium]